MPEDILSDSSQEDGLLWGRCSSVSGHHHIRGESFSRFRAVIGYRKISLSCFGTNVPFSRRPHHGHLLGKPLDGRSHSHSCPWNTRPGRSGYRPTGPNKGHLPLAGSRPTPRNRLAPIPGGRQGAPGRIMGNPQTTKLPRPGAAETIIDNLIILIKSINHG